MAVRRLLFVVAAAVPGAVGHLSAAEPIVLDPVKGVAGSVIPFAICTLRGDASGAGIAGIIRTDLNKHGSFAEAMVKPADQQKLDDAERARGTIYYDNWLNLGAVLVGKGSIGATGADFQLYNTQGKQVLLNKKYTLSGRRLAHQIADDIVQAVLNQKGFFSSRLLFVRTAGPARNIFMCDADGGNIRQLTKSSSLCIFPDWFPNGQDVVFTGYMEGRPIIYKLSLSSLGSTKLLSMPGMNTSGAVSPNGQQLAAILDKDGLPELYAVDLGGGARRRLTRGRAAESSPSWSPDGRRIVYSSEEGSGRPQIYMISASGGTPQRITSGVSSYCTSPAWSPDGKKIAFVAQFGANFDICIYSLDSGHVANLTNNPSNDEEPSWARDSRHIAFNRNGRIMLIDSETGKTVPFVSDGIQPAWQP